MRSCGRIVGSLARCDPTEASQGDSMGSFRSNVRRLVTSSDNNPLWHRSTISSALFSIQKRQSSSVSNSLSQQDLDFYEQLAGSQDLDGDVTKNRQNEQHRIQQEELKKNFDKRTGRPWSDPWEITEEQWMGTTTIDDLPSWSPELVSRISQERVTVCEGASPSFLVRYEILTKLTLLLFVINRRRTVLICHC